jgi:hypothetical protein
MKDDTSSVGRKPYLLREDKRSILRAVAIINRQFMKGDEWMKDNCVTFNGRNHESAFIAWVQTEYPPGEPPRLLCNDKIITKVQLRNWIQTSRSKADEINEAFKDDASFSPVPRLDYLKDGALTEAEKKALAEERKRQRMIADAQALRDLFAD